MHCCCLITRKSLTMAAPIGLFVIRLPNNKVFMAGGCFLIKKGASGLTF